MCAERVSEKTGGSAGVGAEGVEIESFVIKILICRAVNKFTVEMSICFLPKRHVVVHDHGDPVSPEYVASVVCHANTIPFISKEKVIYTHVLPLIDC